MGGRMLSMIRDLAPGRGDPAVAGLPLLSEDTCGWMPSSCARWPPTPWASRPTSSSARALLGRIGMDEEVLLPDAWRQRDGEPLSVARRLRADHGSIVVSFR
jgi:hypothetical protein